MIIIIKPNLTKAKSGYDSIYSQDRPDEFEVQTLNSRWVDSFVAKFQLPNCVFIEHCSSLFKVLFDVQFVFKKFPFKFELLQTLWSLNVELLKLSNSTRASDSPSE